MTLTVGKKVYYPGRGPCVVEAVVEKVVCGTTAKFYKLALLDGSAAELFVPVRKCLGGTASHLAWALRDPQVTPPPQNSRPGTARCATARTWRQREFKKLKLFRSGNPIRHRRRGQITHPTTAMAKTWAMDRPETLHRARTLLICKISEVVREKRTAAEARIDRVLNPGESPLNKWADLTFIFPAYFVVLARIS